MYKKIFSVILAAILVAVSVSVLSLCVSAETLAAGSYPYAVNGTKTPIVKSSASGEVYSYNDHLVKQAVDNLTDSDFISIFKPYNHSNANEVVNNKTLVASSLESYSASSDNVYGTSGKSLKATYISASNAKLTPANSVEQYYHYIRAGGNAINLSASYKDTLAVGFWVKTSHPVHIAVRLAANTTGTESFMVSDRIAIPAGESFVEIPFSNFKTVNAGFNTTHSSGDIRIYATDIYFRALESFTDTRDIWFDNIGFYNYTSNSGKALHSSDAIAKNSIENYTQNGTAVIKDSVSWNADSLGTISVCNPTSGVSNPNAYNGNGQSLQYSTSNVSTVSYNRFRTNGSINTKNADGDPTGKTAKLAVWVKTDRAIKMFLTADDSTTSNSGKNRYQSDEHLIPAGESILVIPLTEFDTQYVIGSQTVDNQFKWDYLGSINFYFKAAVNNSANKNANVWVDNIAIIPGEIDEGPIIPDTKVTHTDGFTEIALNSAKWTNKKATTSTVVVDTSAAYKHSGNTNLAADNSALKVTYSNISSTESLINFYYNDYIRLNTVAPYIYETDSVLAFWVRADQSVDLRITYMDYDSVSGVSKQSVWKVVTVPAGESLVKIDMDEMSASGTTLDCRYAYQLQFDVRSNAQSTKTSGELYFDAFGYYDADTTNNIPEGTKPPEIPTTVVKHEIGFSEVTPDPTKWITKKTDNVTIAFEDNSSHYHQGKTNVAANTGALKVAYNNLSPTASNVSLYSEARIQLTNTAPYTYGENSVLSFWAYTDQSVNLTVTYMDYSNTDKKSVQCKKMNVTLPIGESLVKIPMKDLVPSGHEMGYRFAYQLQFFVYSNDDSYKADGNIWFDGFGFYDSELVINDKPLSMPKDTFIWWDFDNGTVLDEVLGNWAAKFVGVDGLGLQLELEKSAANVYGAKGNSLKLTYNRALAENNIPCIRVEQRIATTGDGIIFWVKSEEKTTLRVVAADANSQIAHVDGVPVTIGYNIINLKWSDFTFTDANLTGKPDMRSIYQFQIRPNGATGTLWVDQIGFSNVKNDGSTAYNSILPPNSYKGWNDGFVSNLEDFEKWPGDDDMGFCTYWYFNTTGVFMPNGKITLEKNSGNTYLQMAFDQTDGKTVELLNITKYTEIDPKGGISFWAKSSEKRYYTLKLVIGGQYAVVNFMGDVNGRTYNIPFSAFWNNNRADKPFAISSTSTISIDKIMFISDSTCNPPAAVGKLSGKFTLCLDDIKFVDSKSFVRAGLVDYTENGVNLKADKTAFKVGVFPKITKTELSAADKQAYLKECEAKDVLALYNITAVDTNGKELIPQAAVTLTFDVPKGYNTNQIGLYQVYLDGSLSKRNISITEDGKITTAVYRIGEYILTVEDIKDSAADNSSDSTEKPDNAGFPWLVVIIVAVVVLAIGVILVIYFVRKGRGK